jgi:hypothetical protein
MVSNPKKRAGPPMTLGNMRELGVQRLLVSCLNPECLNGGRLDVSAWPAETAIPSFRPRMVCAKCGAKDRNIDVRPNWKEQPTQPTRLRWE